MSLEVIPRQPADSGIGVISANILRQNELVISAKTEMDIANTSYTVAAGKRFAVTAFVANYDSGSTVIIRLKKQTGGAGAFNLVQKILLAVGGQGQATVPLEMGNGIYIGDAGDVFKLTAETSLIKGTVWGSYAGIEA